MCGIEAVFGKNINQATIDVFLGAVDIGKSRGRDATGIVGVKSDGSSKVFKDTLPGDTFLARNAKEIKAALDGVNVGIIGHNRYATMGANTRPNAHPFKFDNIVGVHNGVIGRSELNNLPTKTSHEVDSARLFLNIDEHGLDRSIKDVDGDWALVWYDKKENKFFFYRNNMRPLWYRFSKDKGLFWAVSDPTLNNYYIDRESTESDAEWHAFKPLTLYSLTVGDELELKVERTITEKERPRWEHSARSYSSNNNSSGNWWERASTNVIPFRPKPKKPIHFTRTGAIQPINSSSRKFDAIEDVPIFDLMELREFDEHRINSLYDRAVEARRKLVLQTAIAAIDLSYNNWSGKLTWRPSHSERVRVEVLGFAALMEKKEYIEYYIRLLDGHKKRHELFKQHIAPKETEESEEDDLLTMHTKQYHSLDLERKIKDTNIAIGATFEMDVEEPDGTSTIHTLLTLPAHDRDKFDKDIEDIQIEHKRDFLDPDETMTPAHDLSGGVVLSWTAGQDVNDKDHVATCKRVHKMLDYLVSPLMKNRYKDDRRDSFYDNFDKACKIRSFGMEWYAPPSLWVRSRIERLTTFAQCKKAVEWGLKDHYIHPLVYSTKMLELKEAA